jgi:uncharacterized linocin/CFP29 family protein
MSNYGRDALWDDATWAELDQVVAEEAKRVRVGQKVFRTEDVRSADGAAPFWISRTEIDRAGLGLTLPEEEGTPFVEISVPFRLTPAQAEAEAVLHTARTLARAAAMYLALAEDHVVFRGNVIKYLRWGVRAPNARAGTGLVDVSQARGVLPVNHPPPRAGEEANELVNTVNAGLGQLAAQGWTDPYALVLGTDLYETVSRRLRPGSDETASHRLAPRLRHCVVCGALDPNTGILVSLAGEGVTIFTSQEPRVGFSGQQVLNNNVAAYIFRVYERIQYVVRDPSCVRFLSR